MLTDKLLYFSEAQVITATAVSTNQPDFLAYRDIGTGPNDIELFASIDQAFLAAGAATLTISLECDDNAAFSSPTTLLTTTAIAKGALVIGYNPLQGLKIPAGCERYVQLRYTVGTGPFTAGMITAALVLATQSYRAYPNIAL